MSNYDSGKRSKKIPIIIFIVAIVGFVAYGKITNHLSDQWFLDRIAVSNYEPSAEIEELVEKSSMNDEGRLMFYASKPELNERVEFNENCKDLLNESSMVLGCYNGQIYIFKITDERIKGVKYVTSAHEMLHAAYDRLGIFERNHINELVAEEVSKTKDPNILEQLKLYSELEPGHETNEMHSILGTESRELSPELEEYYSRYFYDRSIVVNEHEKYKGVFDELADRADEIEQKMAALETEINIQRSNYEASTRKLSNDIDVFNLEADNGSYSSEASFYARRNEIIAEQNTLSRQVDDINLLINEYNEYVVELQALGRDVQILQNSLDSKKEVE